MPSPVDITFKPIQAPQVGYHGYTGLQPGKRSVLKAGHQNIGWEGQPGRALTTDIILDQDIAITMRDGAVLHADIYRSADWKDKIPAILSWSPFGKTYNGHHFLPHVTWKACVKADEVSGLEKFEGLDPAVWCPYGYAIINVDTRGAGDSDGNIEIMGSQEAEDGFDVIEALAKMEWCNGNIGMAGNSALAISQYFIAAQAPPSLKAIAPWEGCSDMYREQFVRGGIFSMSNFDMIVQWILRGKGGVEDFEAMWEFRARESGEPVLIPNTDKRFPLQNAYWEDKRVNFSKIKIPALLSGSDHSGLHTMGTVRAWLEIPAKYKWLRWSAYQEWHDLWGVPENEQELKAFFDRFLKEQDNGFEQSIPKVRMSILNYGDTAPERNVVFPDYPIPDTRYTELFLGAEGRLSSKEFGTVSSVDYDSSCLDGKASFTHTFNETTRLIGMSKIHVFMSCPDHDDMCVFVRLRKLDKEGNAMFNIPFPKDRWEVSSTSKLSKEDSTGFLMNLGPLGQLRASQRHIDSSKSIHAQFPFHPHNKQEKIQPGQIVELEIGIWQAAINFEAGEGIRVEIFGSNEQYPELAALSQKEDIGSKGKHIVHFGGEYPSRVILPFA